MSFLLLERHYFKASSKWWDKTVHLELRPGGWEAAVTLDPTRELQAEESLVEKI